MRQIGALPPNLDPKVFEDHLLSLGVKSRFDRNPEGWAVWIFNEDHVARAKQELDAYLSRPDDPKFRESAPAAEARRRREKQLDREYRKNARDVADAWSGVRFRRRPATITMVLIAVVVFVLQHSQRFGPEVVDQLGFFAWTQGEPELRPDHALTDIVHGQAWRLVTPIFLHFSILHIFFNVWWMLVLGTAIERQRGTWRLVVLILVTAVLSNLTEFVYMEWFLRDSHLFGGLSGVVYALFGYVWMKGEYQPEQGLSIDSRNTMLMMVWLFVCMTGAVGPIANAAHVGGLVAGAALGLLRF
ncbi:rhomboid family intramembrane serine protease [Paludisphaera borealis]|uniref:Rhomboid protease GlpG n=1 Tax=Paludisphaera borealis TaxID=1387353 RepID=A0A1U7CQ44_9BACT|nr:rhomboid family intramembrane serine protease [Paludisphaera borealis]APW61065.1 Rhomboid protease GlpG [Paludisphaera borealis]